MLSFLLHAPFRLVPFLPVPFRTRNGRIVYVFTRYGTGLSKNAKLLGGLLGPRFLTASWGLVFFLLRFSLLFFGFSFFLNNDL